jgi:hypothetical protein
MLKTVSASERTSKLSEAGGVLVSPGGVASEEVMIDEHGGVLISPGTHDGPFVSPETVAAAEATTKVTAIPSLLRFCIVFSFFVDWDYGSV